MALEIARSLEEIDRKVKRLKRHNTYKRYSKHIAVVSILGRDELTKSFMPFLCL